MADLCTLLRHRPGGEAHIAGVVTQPPTRTHEASIIIMTPFMRAVGAGGLATWQYGENTVCVINVVAQSFSSIPASMIHVEARPGWIDLRS